MNVTTRAGAAWACAGAVAGLLILEAGGAEAPERLLRAAPRVLFLGDSITYGGNYVVDFECWLLARGMTNEVFNLGLPSETACDLTEEENREHATRHRFPRPGLAERLERVMTAVRPDLVVSCYGMNDGNYQPLDEDRFRRFREGQERIRAAAARAGAKAVIHLTPPIYEGDAAGPGVYEGVLARYSQWLLDRRADGWLVADVHGAMLAARGARRAADANFKFAGDGVHPGREGHWAMAAALIAYLGDTGAAGLARSEDLLEQAGAGDPAGVRRLVEQRMTVRRDAWLAHTGHKRPGLARGLPLDQANAKADELTARIRAALPPPFPGSRAQWNGFERCSFPLEGGRMCSVIVPRAPLPGRLWAWKGEFLDAFPATEIGLLQRGVYVVYLSAPNLLGAPEAVRQWNACYAELTARYGMAQRAALIGLSRGGLYCYNWASANPDKVACVYGDAPVCDLKSWPGGKGKGKGSAGDWQLAMRVYGFKDEAEALAFKGNPVDTLKPLADARIALLHVYGDADDVVPWDENTGVLAERYRALGGSIELIGKPGVGHHPHGLPDPTPVVDFIVKQLQAANPAR